MKTLWQLFLARFWAARTAQEKRAVFAAATVVLPILFYMLLWHPAHVAVEKLQPAVPKFRAQAARLHELGIEAESLRHRPQPATLDAGNLKITIEESATRQLMRDSINSLTVQDNNVRITLDSVSFALWLKWLHELQREQHIRAESVSIAALPQSGFVSINATLTNGAAQ